MVDNENIEASEDASAGSSEDDADPRDGMWSDLKNLFPNTDSREKYESQDSLRALHSQDSQEYFSPSEDNHGVSKLVDCSNVLGDTEGCSSEQKKETQDTVPKCLQCSLKSVKSVAVQCEPLLVMTQLVQCERVDCVSRAVQCDRVLQVSCGIQCVQCELPDQSQLSKNMLSKSTCTSEMKDTQCGTSYASIGIDCDLINTAGMKESEGGEENVTPEQLVNVLSLHEELDAACVVSSSQTSLHILNSSSESSSICEVEILSERAKECSSHGNTTKYHKKGNADCHHSFLSSRSAGEVLGKRNSEMGDCERKKTRSEKGKKNLFTQSDKYSEVKDTFEYSSQELLLEMENPTRCSGKSKENGNKHVSEIEERSEILRKGSIGWKSQDELSRKQETSRDTYSSTSLGTEMLNTLQFNSMAVERASSPESLDDETCTELSLKTTRRTLYSRVQTKDTSSLHCHSVQRKEAHHQPSTSVAEGRCKSRSPKYSNQNLCEDLPIKRKRTKLETSNMSDPAMASTPRKRHKLVAYSDSEHSQRSSHSDFHESEDSSCSEMQVTVLKLSEKQSNASVSGNNRETSNITHYFAKQQRVASPANTADTSLIRSTRLRGKQNTESVAAARKPSVIDVQLSDSDFDSDDSCTVTCKTSISRLSDRSRRGKPYSFKEREAIVYYIMDHKCFKRVKGKAMWERMEQAQICPNRTWQSMKEHFIKQILPKIETFKLPPTVERRFISVRR